MNYLNKSSQILFGKTIVYLYGIVTVFLYTGCQHPREQLPNIILILTDDQGYGDLASYGATEFSTPYLDQMAAEGMRFTNFYAAQAVCSASRAAILTGCYPNRIGLTGALFPTSEIGLNSKEVTIAEMLQDKGYVTGIFGKWHLGHLKPFLPLQHGFDEYFGLPYSNDMWPVDFEGNPVVTSSKTPWKSKFPVLPLIEGNEKIGEIKTLEDQSMLVTQYTNRALNFIKKNQDQPFFLYLPHSMPHVPLGVSKKFKGKSKQGMYGDVIMEIDWSVGQILKSLKKHNKNTLVIFTSDNGPWLNFGNHAGSTGGLREGKGTSFEGGQRVPCIMRWPEIIPKGTVNNKLATTLDIFSTVATITGAILPNHKIDGINILPLLKGDKDANPRKGFYYYYRKNNLEAVRKEHWKLVFPHPHISYKNVLPGNDGRPGSYARDTATFSLYNLRRDPGEVYDVKELYPEKVKELEQFAEIAREDLGDDLQQRKGKNVRESGKIDNESLKK